MPGFDFARGNARKLASLPLYALGVVASAVVPRRRDRWVFGSGPGVGEGALELARFVRSEHPELAVTWLAKDAADASVARAEGFDAVEKAGAAGLWRTLRASVVVITHGFGDVNRFGTRRAFVVQLWHGVPLKLIQLDSPATTTLGIPGGWRLRPLLRRFYRRGFTGLGLVPASSELVAGRLRTAFGVASAVVVTGDPRDDVLSRGTADERRARARATVFDLLGLADDGRQLLLFAPTWRDGARDPALPGADEWRAIAAHLESVGGLLVVRPHPLGVGEYAAGGAFSDRIRVLGSADATTITPLLPAFDRLVTDYSSIAFDYSLTGGPMFYLAPDEDDYAGRRGLYGPYRDFSGGREERDWAGVLRQLARFEADPTWASEVLAHTTRLAVEFFAFTDGRNTARVYEEITTRLDARR
jgi:CDP-glycerol glycerophosphotransferase (TagB/SpsB family)